MKALCCLLRIMWIGSIALSAGVASGQDYPDRPVRLITGAAGGGSDYTARQIAQGISGALRQPVIVDNRGTTILATEAGSKSRPDGYSLFIVGSSAWIFPLLQKAPYDVSDFSPISLVEKSASVLAVHPSLPVKSIRELIALAKARPGELNYASISLGGPQHLAAELLKTMTGVNIVNVPYRSAATAITSLISGEVQVHVNDIGLMMPHVKAGRVRALGVTSTEPSVLAPDLPTVASAGLPGYEMIGVTGIFAPVRTPEATVMRLNREILRFLGSPGVKERFLTAGIEIVGSSPEELAAQMKSDVVRIGKLIKDAGIKAE